MLGYPTIKKAEELLEQGAKYKLQNFDVDTTAYILHPRGVAWAARKIAENTLYLNPEKAYTFGLLHDYGHRILERKINKFHAQDGYEQMITMGYSEVARICLTHTFPDKNFIPEDMGYPLDWMLWAKDVLKDIEYDDYDRLIQLCDKFFHDGQKVSIEGRIEMLTSRYNLSKTRIKALHEEGNYLKKYFDKMCNKDVYKILDIKD